MIVLKGVVHLGSGHLKQVKGSAQASLVVPRYGPDKPQDMRSIDLIKQDTASNRVVTRTSYKKP